MAFASPERARAYSKKYRETHRTQRARYEREYRAKNLARQTAYQAELARFQKFLVLQQYSRSIVPFCSCCGERHPEFLQLDHFGVNGRKLRTRITGTGVPFYRRIIKARFPRGLRVLCANCNTATRLGRVCPHRKGR